MDILKNLFFFVLDNWDTTAVSTVVLAAATIALMYYTGLLAKEARNTREKSIEPNVVVTIEPSEFAQFYAILTIENVGSGVAYDISIKELGNHTFKDDRKEFSLNELAFMNLKILKVHQKIEHILGNFDNLPSKVFEFEIVAKDAANKEIKCSNTVDVNCYYDRRNFENKDTHDLVSVVEKIERNFAHIISGFSRLKIDMYNQENRDKEAEQREEMFKEFREQNEKNKSL